MPTTSRPRPRPIKGPASDLGTAAWSARTGGHLTAADKRALLAPLAQAHARNLLGRFGMAIGRAPGRRRQVAPELLVPPRTILTRVARTHAAERLSTSLLHHAERTYAFGAALAAVEGIDVDRELLYAASLLHDVGLACPRPGVEFTTTSAMVATQVVDDVGLSSTAGETIRSAITLHHSPGVTLEAHGPVAYLLSAGAAVDVVGLRSWLLPPSLLRSVTVAFPRASFKAEFGAAWRAESARVPDGRARFLQRYGAFGLAIRLAPFPD